MTGPRTLLRYRAVAVLAVLASLHSPALAELCAEWEAPERIGQLNTDAIPEASGIAISRAYSGRLYHINDSGDGPYFYITNGTGGDTRQVAISGFQPSDVEDIALGPCSGALTCIYVADIGDNAEARASVKLVQIAESERFGQLGGGHIVGAEIDPLRIVEARYPGGPHNAESIAFHPDGNLYLITKEGDFAARTSAPAEVFMLTAAQLAAPAGDIQTFTFVGSLDLPRYIAEDSNNQVATGMDISADGTRVAVLTYRNIFEWNQDLAQLQSSPAPLAAGRDFTVTPLAELPQSEAIAYLPGNDGIVYSTEAPRGGGEAPIIRQMCTRAGS